MKKIAASFLIFILLLSNVVFADEITIEELNERFLSDLDYIERVYQYDLYEKGEKTEEKEEIIVNKRAVQTVLTLGIMNRLSDGTFGEDKTVPFKEFSQALLKITIGDNITIAEQYEKYGDNIPITQAQAAYYLVGAIGYDKYEIKYNGGNPRFDIARSIGILRGISPNAGKYITRGELAQMFFNTIKTDILSNATFGFEEKFEIIEGKNLLGEIFNIVLIEGIVTATPGINIYSSDKPRKNEIDINRVRYSIRGINIGDILGNRVTALAKYNEANEYHLLSIEVDEKNNTILLPFSDVFVQGNYLVTQENEKYSLNDIDLVLHNGENTQISSIINEISNNKIGMIKLCESAKNQGYDIAIVNTYQDYAVSAVSQNDKKIFIKDGLTFAEKNYVPVNTDFGNYINIFKNNKRITFDSIKPGDVISIATNSDNSYMKILVSERSVLGQISEIRDDEVIIEGVSYKVSENYLAACNNGYLPELTLNTKGTFRINFDKHIVSFKSSGNAYQYGYITKVGKSIGNISPTIMIRVFTTDGVWQTYNLAKKLILDGENGVKNTDAYDIINANSEEICYSIIRYELNDNEEVIFLDTARVKEGSPEKDSELLDSERIVKGATWSGKFNWTVASSSGFISLTNSRFSLSKSTIVFSVPYDLEDESSYGVSLSPRFVADTQGSLQLYSVNDFLTARVAVELDASDAGSISDETFSYMVITKIGEAIDKNGEPIYTINGLSNAATSAWEEKKYYSTRQLRSQDWDLRVGDVIQFKASGSTVNAYKRKFNANDIGAEYSTLIGGYPEVMLGRFVDADVEKKVAKISINKTECTYYVQAAGLYEVSNNEANPITLAELEAGDIIFGFGGYSYLRILVFR